MSLLNVNKLLKHDVILSHLNIKYTANTPFARCPFCHKQQFCRFRPESTSDDMTYYCYSCFYSGDIFDIYRAKKYIDTVEKALNDLALNNYLVVQKHAVTDKDIIKYNTEHIKKITSIDEYWYTCQQNIYKGSITNGKQILQSYGLWAGIVSEQAYYKSAFKHIGVCDNVTTLNRLAQLKLTSSLKKGWKGFIVYPYELVPGVISNFYIQNEKQLMPLLDEEDLPPSLTGKGTGFFMMSSVKPTDDIIYAFSDPIMAVQVQHCHFSRGSSHPLPIVAWSPETLVKNWYNVPGKQVILYSKELGFDIFNQAILCGFRAYITTEPLVTSGKYFHEEYRNKGVPFQKCMEKTAVHWTTAFVTWAMRATFEAGVELLNQLPIGFHEKGQIIAACTDPQQKARIDRLFNSDTIVNKCVDVAGYRVHEEQNEWWAVTENGLRERVCSHPMYLDEIIIDPDKNIPPIVTGSIKSKEANIPFSTDMIKFEKSPLKVYKELVLQNAKAVPFIAQDLSKKILETIYAFQKPITVLQPSTLGWCAHTNEFRLANILISGNGFKSITCNLENPPTLGLVTYASDLPHSVGNSLLAHGARNDAFLAIFALFMRNVICYTNNISPKPIGVIGEPWKNPIGWRAVNELAEAYKIPIHVISNKPTSTIRELLSNYNHKIPLIIDMHSCAIKDVGDALTLLVGKNVIVPLTPLQAAILDLSNQWLLIDAKVISDHNTRTAPMCHTINFLEHYLKIGAPTYEEQDINTHVVTEVGRWLAPTAKDTHEFNKMFTRIQSLVRGGRPLTESRVKRLLINIYNIAHGLKQLHAVKWVDQFRKTGEIPKSNIIVLVDASADLVLIHAHNLVNACLDLGSVIKPLELTETFDTAGVLLSGTFERDVYEVPGWVIPGRVWHEAIDTLTTDIAIKLFS